MHGRLCSRLAPCCVLFGLLDQVFPGIVSGSGRSLTSCNESTEPLSAGRFDPAGGASVSQDTPFANQHYPESRMHEPIAVCFVLLRITGCVGNQQAESRRIFEESGFSRRCCLFDVKIDCGVRKGEALSWPRGCEGIRF